MKRFVVLSGLLVIVALLAASVAASALASMMQPAQGGSIVINEVQYDPSPSGSESAYEWVELLNTGTSAVTLDGWRIADNRTSDEIPAFEMAAGEFVVLAAGDGFAELFPSFRGRVITIGGSIGNSLGNSGDRVLLLAADDTVVDGMSYGDNADQLDPPAPDVEAGHSLERVPAGTDTDTAADWVDQPEPSPGEAARMAPPTEEVPTAPPATVPPGAVVVLNEYLPVPRDVDWDGDGEATANDEWIELYNAGQVEIDLRGWRLDDLADGGSDPYSMPGDAVIGPGGHYLVFKRDSGLSLNNGGDSVRLLRPDGSVADETSYSKAAPDRSFARNGDGTGPWTDELQPSPGEPNPVDGSATPMATRLPTVVSTPSAAATHTAAPSAQPSVIATAATPTARASQAPTVLPTEGARGTPRPILLPFLLSEVMYDPETAGNDAADEWVEIYNAGTESHSLHGWSIGDRRSWDELPDIDVPAGGFAVITGGGRALEGFEVEAEVVIVVPDGAIGNGLANHGDVVRLRGPTGRLVDAVSYGDNLDAFDPAVPSGPPGSSIERIPPDFDTDSAQDWWRQPAPSPGRAGSRHVGPPRVVLNEVLPAPLRVDWNGDGTADHTDEWVELYNLSDFTARIEGWRLVRGEDAWEHRFAGDAVVPAGGFLLLHRRQTLLALANSADRVSLVRDDGTQVDSISWDQGPGYDRSLSRTPDGTGPWTASLPPSPGAPNRPADQSAGREADAHRQDRSRDDERSGAGEVPRDASVSAARSLPVGVRVRVRASVTVPPGVFGERVAYVGDHDGGMRVYLRPRRQGLPTANEGDVVLVTGRVADYHGERQLVLDRSTDMWVAGGGPPLVPVDVATGAVGERTEGLLVRVSGRVVDWRGRSFSIDDGSGPVRVAIARSTGVRRPLLQRGETWAVVGVSSQYAAQAPWEGGHRVSPRFLGDLEPVRLASKAPVRIRPRGLPHTGRASSLSRLLDRAAPCRHNQRTWTTRSAGDRMPDASRTAGGSLR